MWQLKDAHWNQLSWLSMSAPSTYYSELLTLLSLSSLLLSLSVKGINNRNNFKGVVRLQCDAEWTAFSMQEIQESASLSLYFYRRVKL